MKSDFPLFSVSAADKLEKASVRLRFWKTDRWEKLLDIADMHRTAARHIVSMSTDVYSEMGFSADSEVYGKFKDIKECLEIFSETAGQCRFWSPAVEKFSKACDYLTETLEVKEPVSVAALRSHLDAWLEIDSDSKFAELRKERNFHLKEFFVCLRDCNAELEEAGFPSVQTSETRILLNFAEPDKTLLGSAVVCDLRNSAETAPIEEDEADRWETMLEEMNELCGNADRLYAPMIEVWCGEPV